MHLPEKYEQNMVELLKDEYSAYKKSLDEKRCYGLRANTLKLSKQELNEKLNNGLDTAIELEDIPWCDGGFYYNETSRPSKSPYYNAGLYYIQEPSAMSAVEALDITPGDKVLDICAAPGGKSTQIGAKLKNKGLLVSNDVSASRAKALLKNIELFGIINAAVTAESPERLKHVFKNFFTKILIDAPCSGEGMFRKDAALVRAWHDDYPQQLVPVQQKILDAAYEMLADGGKIVYSTCTFNRYENEMNVQWFLDKHSDIETVPIFSGQGFENGYGIADSKRLFPHKIKGEGHFVCCMKKSGSISEYNTQGKQHIINCSSGLKIKFEHAQAFFDAEIKNTEAIDGNIIEHKGSLYCAPYDLPSLAGLRIVRPGIFLGQLKKNRFEPSQSLAMALKKDDYKNTIDFSIEDDDLIKYLKGDSFYTSKVVGYSEGLALVCVEGFPLGFAKIQSGRLKNKYPAGWKID